MGSTDFGLGSPRYGLVDQTRAWLDHVVSVTFRPGTTKRGENSGGLHELGHDPIVAVHVVCLLGATKSCRPAPLKPVV